ncbi:MAG: hypothetical protein JNL11_12470 [Bdellovibrionaceae bacterium]|nr:hypothetical protein [Pseudobdellovibrionaceae bacterium]
MIGIPTLKFRSGAHNIGNKDLSLRSLVLLMMAITLILYSKMAQAQEGTGSKSKAVTQKKFLPNESKEETDDNSSDDVDDKESMTAVDVNEDSATDKGLLGKELNTESLPELNTSSIENIETNNNNEDVDNKDVEVLSTLENESKNDMPISKNKKENSDLTPPDDIVRTSPEHPPLIETIQPEPIVPMEDYRAQVAEADMVEVIPKEKNVEIEPFKEYKSYRDRRSRHGFLFSVNAEHLYFQDYASIIDNVLYEEMFGQEDLTIVQASVGYKLNFFLGALTVGAGYGQGTLIDDRFVNAQGANQERTLTIAKTTGQVQWMLDSLMREPYFVPYAGFSMWQMDLTEAQVVGGQSTTYTTGYGTALTVGFLVQLNWIEPETSKLGYMSQGLENTYLDVFWTQYQNTDEELDPSFANDFNFGVGLRLEF